MGVSERVMSLYDRPMWDSLAKGALALQSCDDCSEYRYPPGPTCPHCLSMQATWKPLSGRGTILSWVVFHKTYFEDFPAPYNVVAVRTEEGPIVVSNLVGPEPSGSWIGAAVTFVTRPHGERIQHAVQLAEGQPHTGTPA